jgi:hypothetical protein
MVSYELDWGPISRVKLQAQSERTTTSTVRRVGPPSDKAA